MIELNIFVTSKPKKYQISQQIENYNFQATN